MKNKTITFLGTAHPYRGGIASFNEMLARTFQSLGCICRVVTFTLQYPSLLFPGKSQYTESAAPKDINITREVNSINPFNWIKMGIKIKRERPDILFLRYWTPYLAPALGSIARIVRSNGHTKVVTLADNIVPHEQKVWDRPLTRYFINSCDSFVVMSREVMDDLRTFTTTKKVSISPHPIYENYGSPISKAEAAKSLSLPHYNSYALFFGFIREYKGLDILLEAWALHKERGGIGSLIIAGEFYCDSQPYFDLITKLNIKDSIVMLDRFIADDEVKSLFSLAEMVVQPYKSATQSGVTQIAYNFNTPMIVTNVGGLPEIVPDGRVGYVTECNAESVAEAIVKLFDTKTNREFKINIESEKGRFSWNSMCESILSITD